MPTTPTAAPANPDRPKTRFIGWWRLCAPAAAGCGGRRLERLQSDRGRHVEHALLDVAADQLAEDLLPLALDSGREEQQGGDQGYRDRPGHDVRH